MPKKLFILDQSEAQEKFEALTATAKQLEASAGGKAPPRPVATDDLLVNIEALESWNAIQSVSQRLQSPTSRPGATSPAPALARSAPIASVAGGVAGAQRLSITARILALRPPATITALAEPSVSPARKISIIGRCRAANAPKVKPVAPAAPAKILVPMPSKFSDHEAALREVRNSCHSYEIALTHYGQPFKRPAISGNHADDVATFSAYKIALSETLRSVCPAKPAGRRLIRGDV